MGYFVMKVPVIVRSVMMSLPEFPKKKYQIIYCDPAWDYRDKAKAGKRGSSFKYDVMSIHDIMRLPVWNIADSNCYLFMWVTGPMIFEAKKILKAWDFEFNTIAFTWIKTNPKGSGLFWGMGNSTRSNPEYVILGKKGKLKRLDASVHSVIKSPVRKHSQKPDRVRTDIVKMYGDVSRIELFARTKVHGWDVWGNDPALSYKTLDDTIDTDVS